jgi:hypothetical protein
MSDWISAAEAFEHVLSHEMHPGTARRLLMEAIAGEDLPARGHKRGLSETYFLSSSDTRLFHWNSGAGAGEIDFEAGTAILTSFGHHLGPTETAYVDDLMFSRKHLMNLWPSGSGSPHRPKGSGLQRADAPYIDQMAALVNEDGLSATAAAQRIVGDGSGVPGAGTPESKVRRLVTRFKNGE